MIALSLDDAMRDACAAVNIEPPKSRLRSGIWIRTDSKGKNGKNDAAILINDDMRGGIAHNYQTALSQRFSLTTTNDNRPQARALDRKAHQREQEQEVQRLQVERICADIVRACKLDVHPYLKRKGFPEEMGLVCADPRDLFPSGRFGEALAKALPEGDGPFLIIPGRVGKKLTTVQFITPEGHKKNILRGVQSGAAHRIASGRDTWVCEGIATAMSVRAALRLLGVSATVLSAFSASNVEKVAAAIPGARIAADHDKPVEGLENKGAGEFYARRSDRQWTMPPALGDFNDMHQADGLRAVALHLRGSM